ncbi:hypothetical protein GQ44DRAFT_306405 [Phaeosphaeriaceae sp. PMI808]|nr:hypothetical protein GQ44DRAFT_306405 [Phaeosphaeriaceae sp. PMI808]
MGIYEEHETTNNNEKRQNLRTEYDNSLFQGMDVSSFYAFRATQIQRTGVEKETARVIVPTSLQLLHHGLCHAMVFADFPWCTASIDRTATWSLLPYSIVSVFPHTQKYLFLDPLLHVERGDAYRQDLYHFLMNYSKHLSSANFAFVDAPQNSQGNYFSDVTW